MSNSWVNPNFTLGSHGIKDYNKVYYNLQEPELMTHALQRREGVLGRGGALLVTTGRYSGRSPRDKYIVKDTSVVDMIWWDNNTPMQPQDFNQLKADMFAHMQGRDYFVQDLYGCADANYRLNVRMITELAWHGLFIRHLLRRPDPSQLHQFIPEFTVVNCPSFRADPNKHGCRSDVVIAISFEQKLVLIGGTQYAGENKKAIFSVLNYLLPKRGAMTMHCSANHRRQDVDDVALFFGLSGTGKTTLSADSTRTLIGDDEHGWGDNGVFNFEGGCYAKTLHLNAQSEPEIYATTSMFATVIENMTFDPHTKVIDFKDDSLTANTRCAYPLHYIANASSTAMAGSPRHIIMLTCDAFGVLPPLARLSPTQAVYHFLSGFTAKVAGTERGIDEPQPTFSTCFGAPFMPLRPEVYATLLRKKIEKNKTQCWLVNTGWSAGPYGVGKRMPIAVTRKVLNAILGNQLLDHDYRLDKNFGFHVPLEIDGINAKILDPCSTWASQSDYQRAARHLVQLFIKNFAQYEPYVDADILSDSPELTSFV